MVGEVDRLSVLINDVLEFTRLKTTRKFRLGESRLFAVLQESMQLFSSKWPKQASPLPLNFRRV